MERELWDEIVVDNFAGGGGASTGIKMAIGRDVDIAINHDPAAIAMHKANHPYTEHYNESVWDIDPVTATGGRPVGLCWFSPDCKHFSKAKGGKPVDKNIRGLAWVALKWAATVRPRVIMLENVEEFKTWGPLLGDRPDPEQKGRTFNCFVNALRRHGYQVDWRELRACDYGAPTIRKRFFLIARCDGRPIVWPDPTHGDPASNQVKAGVLKPWHTAAECIDWSIPCPSIFERKKPLAENTLRRIAKGLQKFVIDNPQPFIVQVNHGGDNFRGADFDKPFPTVTAKHGFGLVTPYVTGVGEPSYSGKPAAIDNPLGTVLTQNHKAVITPYITQICQNGFAGDNRSSDIDRPLSTVCTKNEHMLITPYIAANQFNNAGGAADQPLHTILTGNHHYLVAPNLIQYHGEQSEKEVRGQALQRPLMVVDASNRYGLVAASLVKHYGGNYQGAGAGVDKPLPTITTVDHNAIVTSNLIQLNKSSEQNIEKPFNTITAGGWHFGEVRAFLLKYYGQGGGQKLDEPLHTITTKDRFGLITIAGQDYQIVDIGMRMLTPRELFRAQGFPDTYIIEHDYLGRPYPKTAQVARCGNAVPPQLPAALVRANLPELCGMALRKAM